ncbi:MAG TPA: AAA family ATPase [Candidatus Limnocylindria bacterium]|nr:AAA family ATPase [Candidatus Limnocylindria bacterium]
MNCAACGTPNESGRKFCGECGAVLAAACPRCGTPNASSVKFCGECGLDLRADGSDAASPASPASPVAASHATERRLVSVLFVDLVGFTTASEERDAEETREFLSRYFDLARTIIDRYGGTVEKFIGDAVMAVWGAPTAHEDDAERAVRAALELVAAVPTLDDSGATRARAGVLTGEAAVSVGAVGQGIVTGDLVNTASRLQSAAGPGEVFVGEATFHGAAQSVAFEPVGERDLKGKSAPVAAWRAIGLASRMGGSGRSAGLEPPFTGRDDELRLLKDLFHATERERKARLVSVIGQGGIGKTRLAWELEKYLDGLVATTYWHAGRSPAYGDGISYWALAEMVRGRAGIAETDDEHTALARLRATVSEWVTDPAERAWIEPRLAGLLALGPTPEGSREELFAAWRAFLERIAAAGPTVLLFEDLQWADQGMLDFVEHLLDAGRGLPFFVITLARPELLERRPGWGSGVRSTTTLRLDPLPDEAIETMVRGVVPELPAAALAAIVERSAGIPLYMVETLRMLIDRGQLVRTERSDRWQLAGSLAHLEVPQTLRALIASRLDALDPPERLLLQQAAVLGQSFTPEGIAALAGEAEEAIADRLSSLVRRELLTRETNPRSPERGQFQFVQGIVREVAHGLLSKADRRALHLAAARFFEARAEDDLAGVLASHYLDAHTATPPGPEADALAAQARIALRAAADRSIALHSYGSAVTYLERALEITTDIADRGALSERIAVAASNLNDYDKALSHAIAATEAARKTGDRLALLRAQAAHGEVEMSQHYDRPALTVLRAAIAEAEDLPPSVEKARVEAQLSRVLMVQGSPEALEWSERVLASPAALSDPALILRALVTKATVLGNIGRMRESEVLFRGAIAIAEEDKAYWELLRARNNMLMVLSHDTRLMMANVLEGYELTTRVGEQTWARQFLGLLVDLSREMGDLDSWIGELVEATAGQRGFYADWAVAARAERVALRGDVESARRLLDEVRAHAFESLQAEEYVVGADAMIDIAGGAWVSAYDRTRSYWSSEQSAFIIQWAIIGALMAADVDRLRELRDAVPGIQAADAVREAYDLTLSAGLALLGDASVGDAGALTRQATERLQAIGQLMLQALVALALGIRGAGRLEGAEELRASGEAFLRERGMGPVVDRFLEVPPPSRAHRTAAREEIPSPQ